MARTKVVRHQPPPPRDSARDQTAFDVWRDTTPSNVQSIQIAQDNTEPVTIRRGDILSLQHDEDPYQPEWVGRAEGFRQWRASSSSKGWIGEDIELVHIHWLGKEGVTGNARFDYTGTSEEVWVKVSGNRRGTAYDVQFSESLSARLDNEEISKGRRYRIRGKAQEIEPNYGEAAEEDDAENERDAENEGDEHQGEGSEEEGSVPVEDAGVVEAGEASVNVLQGHQSIFGGQ